MKKTHVKWWLRLTFLFAALIAFAVPKANAWVFYADVSNISGLNSSPHLHVGNGSGWYSNFTGTEIAPNIYKFDFSGWSDLTRIAFTKTNTNNDPGNDKWGEFTINNNSNEWKAESGSCYKLNASDCGATRTANYSEPQWPYLFDGTAHGFTKNGNDYEYTLALSNSTRKFRLQKDGTTTALGTTITNKALCPNNATYNAEWTWNPGTSSLSTYENYSGKLVVGPGAYKITINSSLNSVTLTKTADAVTLSSVSISSDNGANYTSVTNNSTVTSFSNLTSANKFLVKTTWSDNSTVYFTFNGNPNSDGSKTLITTTNGNGSSLNADVVSANMKVNVTDKNAATINISEISLNTWTYTPANNETTTSKSITVSKTDSRGNTVNYGHAAISAAGSYVLTENGTSPVVINIDNPRTTITWSDGVPTLVVKDLDAITGDDIYLEGNGIGWTAQDQYKFVYDAETDSYNLNLPNGLEGQEFKIYDLTTNKWYGKDKNGRYSTNVEVGTEITLYSDQDANVWANNWGTSAAVNVNVKFDGQTGLKVLVTREVKWYVIGKQFDNNYNVSNKKYEMTPEMEDGNKTGKFYYNMPDGISNGDGDYFRFHDGTTQYGPASNTDISTYDSKESIQVQNNANFRWKGANEPAVIWLDATNKKIWVTKGKVKLNFKTIEELENKGADRVKNAVFVMGDYLNNNKLAPDFEMSTSDGVTYTLQNVTLRGNNTGIGENKLTFAVVKPDGTMSSFTSNPSPSDLESGTRQYGRAYNITVTLDNNNLSNSTVTFEKIDNSIPFLGIVGYRYQQKSNEDTPNNIEKDGRKGTERGWQESWVLYNEDRTPFRDNDGKYFYSLQWPPKNPVQFAGVRDEQDRDQDVEMSSDNLTFLPDKGANGKAIVKTGDAWGTVLTDDSYDKLFGRTSQTSAPMRASSTGVVGPMAGSKTLTSTQNYLHYTTDNVWLMGSTKIWTGWGGQLQSNGTDSQWDGHANWGVRYNNTDYNGNDTAGVKINAEQGYELIVNAGNFMFEDPTYFKTVDIFIPVDADGTPTGANPTFYTTLGKGDPSILAASTKKDGARVNNSGKMCPAYNAEATYKDNKYPVYYRITRYNGATSSSTDDPEDWDPVETTSCPGGVVFDSRNSKTGDPTLTQLANNYKAAASAKQYFNDRDVLKNGLYFYGLELFDTDGKLIEQVASNTFSIANVDDDPSVNALQLLELTKEGVATINSTGKYNFQFVPRTENEDENFGKVGERWYVTYEPSGTGDYFVVSEKTNKVTKIEPRDLAREAINKYQVVWTTRYFVRAGNTEAYKNAMIRAKNDGIITGYEEPKYTVSYTGIENGQPVDKVMQQSAMAVSANGTVGFITNFTEGTLNPFTFKSDLEYRYYTSDATISYEGENKKSASKAAKPYVPGAYNLRYRYEESRHTEETGLMPAVKFPSTSTIVKADGSIAELGTNGVPEGTMAYKEIAITNKMHHRDLNCVFEFDRPNLSDALLNNYDIYYDVLFTNNDDHLSVLKDVILVDDAQGNTKGTKSYRVTASNVHAMTETFPILAIKGTVYAPHSADKLSVSDVEALRYATESPATSHYQMYHTPAYEVRTVALSDEDATKTYTGQILYCEGINVTDYVPMKFTELQLHQEKFDTGMARWNYYIVNEGMKVNDQGDIIHVYQDGEKTVTQELTPYYYDIEAYIPGMSTEVSWNTNTNRLEGEHYYDKGALFYAAGSGQLVSTADGDNLLASFSSPTYPTIVATPVYIFYRNPSAARQQSNLSDQNILGLKLIGNNNLNQQDTETPANAPANAPMRAPMKATSVGGTTHTVGEGDDAREYVMLRGAAAVKSIVDSDVIYTSVEAIGDDYEVSVGEGMIIINGANNAQVYTVAGVKVAEGNGRHYVDGGIYLVTVNGKTHKVVVK